MEVGTWNGDRACVMAEEALKHHSAFHYWGFDLFEEATAEINAAEFNTKSVNTCDAVNQKLAGFSRSHSGFSFELIKGNSQLTLHSAQESTWKNPDDGSINQLRSADLVFIDGGHSVDTIASDYSVLKQARVILFDDYYTRDANGDCPDTEKVGCNKLVDQLDAILLPAHDQVGSGGRVQIAATGPAIVKHGWPQDAGIPRIDGKEAAVVTTFSDKDYLSYGRRFIESFEKFWPQDVRLHLYHDSIPPETHSTRIQLNSFLAADPDLVAFKARHQGKIQHQGVRIDGSYEYRFDAVRFCHKAFAITHCALNTDADMLFWLDADTITFSGIEHGFLDDLLPKGVFISHLGRQKMHSETGYIGFDLRHPESRCFMEFWRGIYTEDNIFELPEWHDAYVFDVVRRYFESKNLISSHNLAGKNASDHHPFVNSQLGACIDHLIGTRRKQAGCSFAADVRPSRPEFYWRIVPFLPEDLVGSATAED